MCIQMIIAQCYVVVPILDFYLRQGDYFPQCWFVSLLATLLKSYE